MEIRVGYGRANISAKEPVPLGGYGDPEQRISIGVLDNLYTTCIAITDAEGNTVLLITNDICCLAEVEDFKESISKATGVAEENILISATHTHSSPDFYVYWNEAIKRYRIYMRDQMTAAAVHAMESRMPAEMYVASVMTENMNFVRHYVTNAGTICGDAFGDSSSGYAGHESEADGQLQLVKFKRGQGKDIIMTNFQAHPYIVRNNYYEMTPNFISSYRNTLASELDCYVAYWTGAAGNLNAFSRISEENRAANHWEHGVILAKYAMDLENQYVKVNTGLIRKERLFYQGKTNKDPDLLPIAIKVKTEFEANRDAKTAMALAEGYPICSTFHAAAIINNSKLDDFYEAELNAVSVGDLAIATVPCEFFDVLGKGVKEASPFKMTLFFELTNGSISYIPTKECFAHGCYEGHTCKFKAGAGEEIRDELVNMLNNLKDKE